MKCEIIDKEYITKALLSTREWNNLEKDRTIKGVCEIVKASQERMKN